MAEISAAVKSGAFGYNAASYFPNATKDLLVQDVEGVWLGEETPGDMLRRADRVFIKERARGLGIADIPLSHF